MKLFIDNKLLYANNVLCCRVEVKNGHTNKPGISSVTPQFSHSHGRDLLLVNGIGWLGADDSCSIVVGRMVDGNGKVLPCHTAEVRLMNIVNAVSDNGENTVLEIK